MVVDVFVHYSLCLPPLLPSSIADSRQASFSNNSFKYLSFLLSAEALETLWRCFWSSKAANSSSLPPHQLLALLKILLQALPNNAAHKNVSAIRELQCCLQIPAMGLLQKIVPARIDHHSFVGVPVMIKTWKSSPQNAHCRGCLAFRNWTRRFAPWSCRSAPAAYNG